MEDIKNVLKSFSKVARVKKGLALVKVKKAIKENILRQERVQISLIQNGENLIIKVPSLAIAEHLKLKEVEILNLAQKEGLKVSFLKLRVG